MLAVFLLCMFILGGLSFWWIVRKLDQIHALVNSRLSSALKEVRELKHTLGIPNGQEE